MVVYLFMGLILLAGLSLLVYGFMRANPGQIVSAAKIAAFVLILAAIMFLVLSGRWTWALFLLPTLVPWLLRLRTIGHLFKAARGPSTGNASTVETNTLTMELDHDTGEMDGWIKAGAMEGRRLSDLDTVLLLDLYHYCCEHDGEAARLLEAYLDRTLGAEWREGSGAEDASPPPGNQDMTRQDAHSILGLEGEPSEDEIRAAHRRLMQTVHPDRGGNAYLAARVNAAKDYLLDSSS